MNEITSLADYMWHDAFMFGAGALITLVVIVALSLLLNVIEERKRRRR